MKINLLEIQNFKNIEYLKLEVNKLNLISGDNGSGKSSILQAIQYALTDSLPEKLSEYIRWGQDNFKINIRFEHLGKEYDYKLKFATSSSKELKVGDEEYKNSEASKKIKELVNSDLLLYSCFSEQGHSYSILVESPADRLKRFKSILGVDRLSSIIDYSKEQIKSKKNEIDDISKEISYLKSQSFTYMEEFNLPDISSIKDTFQKQEIEKLEKEKFEILLKEWENKNSIYTQLINRKEEVLTLSNSIKEKLFEINVVEFNSSEYQSLLEEKRKEELEYEKYKVEETKYDYYNKSISSITNQISSETKKVSEIKLLRLVTPSATKEELDTLEKSKTNLLVSLNTINKHIELAKQGKCSTCGQDFIHSEIDLIKQKQKLEEEYNIIESFITKGIAELNSYDKKFQENSKNQEIKDFHIKNIEKLTEEFNLIPKVEQPMPKVFNFEYLDNKIKEMLSVKLEYEKQSGQIEIYKKQLMKYEVELETLDKNIVLNNPGVIPVWDRPILFDSNLYSELKKEIYVYEQKVQELERIKNHNKKIKELEEENKNKIKEKDFIYYIKMGEVKDLEDARNILEKQFSGYLIEKGTQYVEQQMNTFFQRCYNKYSVYFKQTENKKSIDFYYTDLNSERITSAALCSGFEKQLLSIAFRVALASITNLGFLILDEIDSDASDENSKALYSNLLESELFEQIICITHHETTKQSLINEYNASLISLGGDIK